MNSIVNPIVNHSFLTAAWIGGALLLGGCAATGDEGITSPGQVHAECVVCRHNADLACVDVTVTDRTPHTVYKGQTYYFCSPMCVKEFEQNPERYLKK